MLKQHLAGINSKELIHSHTHDGDTGMLVFTKNHIVGKISAVPFFNPTFGAAMNQAVIFTGTPEGIHDGTDSTLWTGAVGSGVWDFTDTAEAFAGTKSVSITNADNLDFATFSDATQTDMTNYVAITGYVFLRAYDGSLNDIRIQMKNNAVDIGISVSLNNYITTSTLGAWQAFVIPKADLDLNSFIIDEMNIIINRTSGGKPTIYFDNMQIENIGAPLSYIVTAAADSLFHITQIILTIADTGTGSAAYAYNKIGAITTLAKGITFSATSQGEVLFSSAIKQNSDLLNAAGTVSNFIDDGTNTFYTINIDVSNETPVIIDSRNEDELSFTINDDLSGLDIFTAIAVGYKENIADRQG